MISVKEAEEIHKILSYANIQIQIEKVIIIPIEKRKFEF